MVKKRIHCIGILVVDALSGPLSAYPIPRIHTQVQTQSVSFRPGGGAANTPGALARMGLSVEVFSKIGDDSNGAFLLKELTQCGVGTSQIAISPQENTPFTFVGIHEDGDRTFIHTPGTNSSFSVDDIDMDALLDTEILLYQDCWVLPCLDGHPGAMLLKHAQRRGVVTLLDECWGMGPNRETWEAMAPYCDYMLPSLDDMRVIYPDRTPADIVNHLLGFGCGTVILKMGKHGCLVANSGGLNYVSALPAHVVDTTGAGDCWNAGFIAGLAHGETPHAAARLGAACAAFGVEAVGGCTGVPTYERVRERAGMLLSSK